MYKFDMRGGGGGQVQKSYTRTEPRSQYAKNYNYNMII